MITLINRQRKIPLDQHWLHELIREILAIIEYEDFSLGVLITTNKTIQRYNETYRHKKGPTDILSFSLYPHHKPGSKIQPIDDEKNLGDLILAPEYIHKSAHQLNVPFEHRVMILVIHGICHLIGYDHETDKDYEIMQALEDDILANLSSRVQR